MTRIRPLAHVVVLAWLVVAAWPSAAERTGTAAGQRADSRGGAQDGVTPVGAIFGRVVDRPGVPFPGVLVTIEGSSLQTPRSLVTDRDGSYEFAGLPDGAYSLDFRITGFCPVGQDAVAVVNGGRFRANATIADNASHLRCEGETGETRVRFETTMGAIEIAINPARAPITSLNFLKYVDGRFYDGGRFHRATRADNYTPAPPNRPLLECIQAGVDAARTGGFPPIPLERTSVTGLKHFTGTVSMARGNGADTATSDFFILLNDQPSLDFGGKRFDDGQGAAAFGVVTSGMDVVRRIQQQPVQAQALRPPIAILRAYRVK